MSWWRLAPRHATVADKPALRGRKPATWGTFSLLMLLLASVGCAHPPAPPVQPWQREHLAKRAMRFDADPLETHFKQHWFGSREGSDLGYGTPGGGCGCN